MRSERRPGPARTATWARRPSMKQHTRPELKLEGEMSRPEHESDGPSVVALGGGHGLATALRAIRTYASNITAIVSVADDGGSSGRLRRDLDVLPPGDLRKALVALAGDENLWSEAFEYRFPSGELAHHSLGNLLLVGLAEVSGDFGISLAEAQRLLATVGRVLPATRESVVLKGDVDGAAIEGQDAIQHAQGDVRHIELIPYDAAAYPDSVDAILNADQIVIAPGSLYTSIVPVLCVQGIRDAMYRAQAKVVQIANLVSQSPETAGLSGTDHLRVVCNYGARVNTFVYDPAAMLGVDEASVVDLGARPVAADVAAGPDCHDPSKLGDTLSRLC